jgi:hypothetical protein
VRKTNFLKLALKYVALFIGVYAFLLLFVPLLGFGWHLFHGNYISHHGWRITVPKGYYVTNEPHGPAFWKLTLGAPHFEVPFAHVSFYTSGNRPFKAATDYSRFEDSQIRNALESGYHFKQRAVLPIGNRSAYCVELDREKKQPRSVVRCAVEESNMYILFEGDPRYIPELARTLQEMFIETPSRSSES